MLRHRPVTPPWPRPVLPHRGCRRSPRWHARLRSEPQPALPFGAFAFGREARLGPSRASTACTPAKRCGLRIGAWTTTSLRSAPMRDSRCRPDTAPRLRNRGQALPRIATGVTASTRISARSEEMPDPSLPVARDARVHERGQVLHMQLRGSPRARSRTLPELHMQDLTPACTREAPAAGRRPIRRVRAAPRLSSPSMGRDTLPFQKQRRRTAGRAGARSAGAHPIEESDAAPAVAALAAAKVASRAGVEAHSASETVTCCKSSRTP